MLAKPALKLVLALAAVSVFAVGLLWPAQRDEQATARTIITDAGVAGGLVVHLGCGEGKLTAALRAGPGFVVHGLDADAKNVARARNYLAEQGLYGPVAVDRLEGERLPYADNTVNLLVAESLGRVPMSEVRRVLAPGGVAYIKAGADWQKQTKPRPENIDEWTHFLHDPSGNAVAHDDEVGPPRHLQWTAAPLHTRSHEHTPSINALVSAGGRIFYIADEGPISSVKRPAQWFLVARDAFSGVLLWQKAITKWYPHLILWGQTPYTLQRRLVAVGDRVCVTLGFHAPLSAVDAATGKLIKVYPGTFGTEEVLWHDGTLLLVVREVTKQRVAELDKLERLAAQKGSPLDTRDTSLAVAAEFRSIEQKAPVSLLALDAATGRELWRKRGDAVRGLRGLTLCAEGRRVFFQRSGEAVCLDLKTGNELWAAPAPAIVRLVWRGKLICAGRNAIAALAADSGKLLWRQKPTLVDIRDAFVAGGALWLGGFRPIKGKRGPAWGPYFAVCRDLERGDILKQIEPENPGHHHRCYMNKATDRYILGGRRGTEIIDLKKGEVLWHSWARGVCRYGVMPCNGLLYVPPHACGCYVGAKLKGFNALATGSPRVELARPAPQPEPGPAYGSRAPALHASPAAEWPTYRHDPQRSGATANTVQGNLRLLWRAAPGGKLSALTVAGGRVLVASREAHRVCAFDARSGKQAWSFIAGGRVDSPPTVYQGRALFGAHDGCVYSVRLSDGALAWRLRVARAPRLIVAREQVESTWPAPGAVLVQGGVAYCLAGRSSYLDCGIDICLVDPATGSVRSISTIYSPDPVTGRQPKQFGPAALPGARADILCADASHIYLRDMAFDLRGKRASDGAPHLLTLTDFLDDTWPHRSYWIFGTQCSLSTGCSGRAKNLIYGRLLVFNEQNVFGYGRRGVHWSNQLEDGFYRLFALRRSDREVLWEKRLPIYVRAMALAGDTLFVAGPPTDPNDDRWAPLGPQEAKVLAVSASDGSVLASYDLEAPPVLDGLAVAYGKLYLALTNGAVVCLGPA